MEFGGHKTEIGWGRRVSANQFLRRGSTASATNNPMLANAPNQQKSGTFALSVDATQGLPAQAAGSCFHSSTQGFSIGEERK